MLDSGPTLSFQGDSVKLPDMEVYTLKSAKKLNDLPGKTTASLQYNDDDTRYNVGYITYENVAAWKSIGGTKIRFAFLTSSPQASNLAKKGGAEDDSSDDDELLKSDWGKGDPNAAS